jgi:hypothetical protein
MYVSTRDPTVGYLPDPRLQALVQQASADRITPALAASAMLLQGYDVQSLSARCAVPQAALTGWIDGTRPFLDAASMDRIELVIGIERGRLSVDRTHVFRVGGSQREKEAMARLSEVTSPAVIFPLCPNEHSIEWPGKIGLYAGCSDRPSSSHGQTGGVFIIVWGPRRMFSRGFDISRLPGMRWARASMDRSRIVLPTALSERIRGELVSVAGAHKVPLPLPVRFTVDAGFRSCVQAIERLVLDQT